MFLRLMLPVALVSLASGAPLIAQTLTTLKNFGPNYGGLPWSTMVEVRPGLFYGTTSAGGTESGGSLFRITSAGAFQPLSSFTSATGYRPVGQLVQASDGKLYGTTFGIGIQEPGGENNPGSVLFGSDLTGNVIPLINFTQFNAGASATPVTAGADGALYGAVGFFDFPSSPAIIYRYALDGTFTILHEFAAIQDYMNPLVQANDANLYGVVPLVSGTELYTEIYRISPSGTYTPLLKRQFTLGTSLAQGSDGKLYGVDTDGPSYQGEAFSLNLDGSGYKVLAAFGSFPGDCFSEFTGLTLASDGALYGGCAGGFANNFGGIFRITAQAAYQQVYSFTPSEGIDPTSLSSLAVQGTDGVLYGEFFSGANLNAPPYENGSIYAFNAALPKPLPSTQVLTPAAGKVGTAVLIFGSGFLQASSITFNGVSAPFTVASSIYLRATVPAGATTGPITISTPNGTATSSAIFTVN